MKADNTHTAARLVGEVNSMKLVIDRLLEEESPVFVRVQNSGSGRDLGNLTVPSTYIAKALSDYREKLVLEAEQLGVDFT